MHRSLATASAAALSILASVSASAHAADVTLANALPLPGTTTDLAPAAGTNGNRFGFFSDLYFDRPRNAYYALPDRGPGGGVIDYRTRVE
ncbi:MAG TPA: hypothetical protein VK324_07640, partial [Tepidisphaeraceae bacterium]|nr:hypothetical protein [Tepidisphaeraceae bacterium]